MLDDMDQVSDDSHAHPQGRDAIGVFLDELQGGFHVLAVRELRPSSFSIDSDDETTVLGTPYVLLGTFVWWSFPEVDICPEVLGVEGDWSQLLELWCVTCAKQKAKTHLRATADRRERKVTGSTLAPCRQSLSPRLLHLIRLHRRLLFPVLSSPSLDRRPQ